MLHPRSTTLQFVTLSSVFEHKVFFFLSLVLTNTRRLIYSKPNESQWFLVCCPATVSSKFSDSLITLVLAGIFSPALSAGVWFHVWRGSHVLTLAAAVEAFTKTPSLTVEQQLISYKEEKHIGNKVQILLVSMYLSSLQTWMGSFLFL